MAQNMSLKSAALINAAGRYSKVVLALLVNAALARILMPGDFGVIAIVTVFTTLFTSVSDMGFGTAVVQRKDLSMSQINDIYSFTGYMSLAIAVAFFLCGWPIAAFFQDDCYISLCQILSISLFFSAFNMVPNGIMNREKRFKSLALRTFAVYAISSVLAIASAIYGAGYYSLAIQSVVNAVATFAWNVATTRPRFSFRFKISSVKDVLSYSGFQFAFNVVTYISDNLANFIAGKLFGSIELGYFNRAATLTTYPVTNLAGVITPVLHPILSDYRERKEVIYKSFIKVSKLLAYSGLFVSSLFCLAANELVWVMYGPGWEQSAECLQWLSLAIMPSMMNAAVGGVFQSLGETRLLFINSCINTAVTVIAIFAGALLGGSIESLAIWVGLSRFFHLFSAHCMLIVLGFRYPMSTFVKEYSGVAMSLVLTGAFSVVYLQLAPAIGNQLVSLIVKATVLAVPTLLPILIIRTGTRSK